MPNSLGPLLLFDHSQVIKPQGVGPVPFAILLPRYKRTTHGG